MKRQNVQGTALDNCNLIMWWVPQGCADPTTIFVNYSLYMIAIPTGENYQDERIMFKVFQIDGERDENHDDGNFVEYITIGKINYIDCLPTSTAKDVDLGNYDINREVGILFEKIPFSIDIQVTGDACSTYPFVGHLISNSVVDDHTLSAMNGDIGIRVFEAEQQNPVTFNNKISFGYANGNMLSKNFEAAVIFLKKPSNTGQFTATLNYEIWLE